VNEAYELYTLKGASAAVRRSERNAADGSFSAACYSPNKWAKPMKARDIRLAVMNAIG
jgi:hypothetical protein